MSDLAHENAVLNRFEELLVDFCKRESLTPWEAMNVLVTSAAHNIGHGTYATDTVFNDFVSQFVRRVRTERGEHKRDCVGKTH